MAEITNPRTILTASQIFKEGAEITAFKILDDPQILKEIEETIQRQKEVLKLTEVDEESLRRVIHL